ncbi:MAG: hypothetical protein ACRCYS_19685 [Beijerinckiaceae bacterium]
MIRPATLADIPKLLEWGQRFADKAGLVDHVGYNPADMENTFRVMIEGHVIFVGEAGAIGAMKGPHPFNYAHTCAQEVFWWSEGREGLRLLDALEAWARSNCHSLRMITLEAVEPERTAQIYTRRGFAPLEHGYIKVF